MTYSEENKVDGIPLVTENAQEHLNPRQEISYREHRRELVEWMLFEKAVQDAGRISVTKEDRTRRS